MVQKAVSFAISINVIFALFYHTQCNNLTASSSCMKTTPGAVCSPGNCTNNCMCSSSMDFDPCSQSCNSSMACSSCDTIFSCDHCNTTLSCDQRAWPASNVPYIFCNSTEKCQQNATLAFSKKMIALSNLTYQVYANSENMLQEMVCKSNTLNGVCSQSCDFCNSTLCSANSCEINCTNCGNVTCKGSSRCKSLCNKQCNKTICESPTCNLVCESGSQCTSMECSNDVKDCSLECRSSSYCDLNCNNANTCNHSCALSGLCYTRGPGYVDKHNGQCGMCNCTSDIRNCVQRCQSQTGRCLGLYCSASTKCEQYSKSTDRSFVMYMISTAPVGKQVCDNGSDCWHMLCYGSNCTLICKNKATCGHMLCKANTCSFHCKSGAFCDVITCLPGSARCEYHCEASAYCRARKCEGEVCVGAPKYSISSASSFMERKIFHLQIFFTYWVAFITGICIIMV